MQKCAAFADLDHAANTRLISSNTASACVQIYKYLFKKSLTSLSKRKFMLLVVTGHPDAQNTLQAEHQLADAICKSGMQNEDGIEDKCSCT